MEFSPPFSRIDPVLARQWAGWQPKEFASLPALRKGLPDPLPLERFDPGAKPFSSGEKAMDKAAVEALAEEPGRAAEPVLRRPALQAAGAAAGHRHLRQGRHRPRRVRPHERPGRARRGLESPTEAERAHDYLWRIHAQVPAAGETVVFNRSHYEDVLVPVVQGWITPEQHAQRLAHINDFERMLAETGTVIVKFMLHISKDEQRERLQARLDDPAKHWKFEMGDIAARKQWDDYQRAYATLLAATHTPWAPWTIVPADSKTHRNLMIATVLREVLRKLDLRYPEGDPALAHFKIE